MSVCSTARVPLLRSLFVTWLRFEPTARRWRALNARRCVFIRNENERRRRRFAAPASAVFNICTLMTVVIYPGKRGVSKYMKDERDVAVFIMSTGASRSNFLYRTDRERKREVVGEQRAGNYKYVSWECGSGTSSITQLLR